MVKHIGQPPHFALTLGARNAKNNISSRALRLLRRSEMLSARRETILKAIIEQYITKARPVSSQSLTDDCDLGVSSATIRNEMSYLEESGFITHPHTSSGSIPCDSGYRYYVQSIGDVKLAVAEQLLVSHLFHQVEKELDEWLNLAASLVSQMVQNAVMVTTPRIKYGAYRFKHLELVSLTETMVLMILVLDGARVREQLINFEQTVSQAELTELAGRLSTAYAGLTSAQIAAKGIQNGGIEQQVNDLLIKLIKAENKEELEEPCLDGLHFTLNQPEFTHDHRNASTLMELVEQRKLLSSIIPPEPASDKVRVIIGGENKAEAIRDYSVVLARYGLPEEATGMIGVIGPTRMPYVRTIATVNYLASVLSWLMASLYGKESSQVKPEDNSGRNNDQRGL